MDRLKELHIDRNDARKGGGGLVLGLLAALLVVAAAASWWWYSRQAAAAEVRTAAVERVSGAAAGAATVLDASGYVTARRRATVSSKITGKVEEVLVEEGMRVREGQLLARLDSTSQERQLALAQAELEAAKRAVAETEVRLKEAGIDLERARTLVAEGVEGQAVLDAAQAAYDALAARLEVAREEIEVARRRVAVRQQELADTEIRAPFSGVAVSKNAQPGEMISPISAGGGFTRTGICTLVDMTSLEIEVDVNEAYINRVRDGQRAVAVLDAYPDWKIPASVITTVPTADRQKATVRVRLAFDELDPRILPDMGVKVSFLTDGAEPAEAAAPQLLVPAGAVRRDGEREVVFVVADERAERRAVTTGERLGDRIEIEAGLVAGERVVVEGPADLADGDPVRVEKPGR